MEYSVNLYSLSYKISLLTDKGNSHYLPSHVRSALESQGVLVYLGCTWVPTHAKRKSGINNLVKTLIFQLFLKCSRNIFVVCLPFRDFSTAFFNSIPISGSLSGSMLSSQSNQQLMSLESNAANSLNTSKPSVEPTAASVKPTDDAANKDGLVFAGLLFTYVALFTVL